jgi:hypothetical protein
MAEQYLRIVAPLNGGTNRCAKRDTAVLTGRVAEALRIRVAPSFGIDAGYRYGREHEGGNMNQLYAALAVKLY